MRQTTLFDFNVEKVKVKCLSSEIDDTNYPEIQKVAYKPSKLDSDNIAGFDSSLNNWIYPTNYPLRDYQLQIVQQCLYKNTLVCLPTGLGKTFIATVTMYNFYRWYPSKKIVFVAPTRPLVRQQMLTASNCVPIDDKDIVEMTGSIAQTARLSLWQEKRVFYLTAQVFVNDLTCGMCPTSDVVMVVFDEAHKATGNHSYCQAVRLLSRGSRLFRVLGLSATPGNDIATIQNVIHNLLISHIELRTDECKDIKAYSHVRLVEEIIVPLGSEVTSIRNRLYNICEPLINRLKDVGALKPNVELRSMSKFGLLTHKEQYKSSCENVSYRILTDFAILISLYHAVELVQQYGLRPLFHFLSNALTNNRTMPHISELMKNNDFMTIVKDLEHTFETDVFVGGHPKLEKLKVIVKEHFEKHKNANGGDKGSQTRVMVFSQFRESVNEILKLLEQLKPLVRPMGFVGRAQNGSQKEQMEAMRLFINGSVNVLVSTCIGEEGLDVGEVDLIVCFDSQGSPIRLVQRLGRTGRKREGRIVILLSEGKEVNTYRSSLSKKSRIHSAIFEGYKHLSFYPDNPRLVPLGLDPPVTFQKHKLQRRVLPSPILNTIQKSIAGSVRNLSQIPKIEIKLESSGHMRFLSEESSELSTFSQRYNTNKHKKSLYQAQKTFRIAHSSLTESTVSILKLKEMHCRGKTNMIFHLNNSRKLDIEEPMSQAEHSPSSQHSLDSFSISISSVGEQDCLDSYSDEEREKSRVKPPLSREEFNRILTIKEPSELALDDICSHEDSFNWSPLLDQNEGIESDVESTPDTTDQEQKVMEERSSEEMEESNKYFPCSSTIVTLQPRASLPSREESLLKSFSWSPLLHQNEGIESDVESTHSHISESIYIANTVGQVKKETEESNSEPTKESNKDIALCSTIVTPLPPRGTVPINVDRKESLLKSFNRSKHPDQNERLEGALSHIPSTVLKGEEVTKDRRTREMEGSMKPLLSSSTMVILQPSASRVVVPIITDRKESLLKSFNRGLGRNGHIFPSCSTPFQLKTSTPIVRNKQSLLNSFHKNSARKKPEIGFESAMNLLDASANLTHGLSTDLFDDNDFVFDDTENDASSKNMSTKSYFKSSILRSFHVEPLTSLNLRHDSENLELNSDFEDMFVEHRVKKVEKNCVDSDEDLFSDNEEQFSSMCDLNPNVAKQELEENGDVSVRSEDSQSFLQTKCPAREYLLSERSPSFGSCISLDENNLSKSPSFGTHISLDENNLSKSPSFGSTTEEEDVNQDPREPRCSSSPEFVCHRNPQKKKPRHLNDFFLSQADVSGHRDEDDSDGSFLDQMEASFIDDSVAVQEPDTQMQQIYVRSIQSPFNQHKNRRNPIESRHEEFLDTQLPLEEDYLYDSFVVPDDFKSPSRKRDGEKNSEKSLFPGKRFKRLVVLEDSFME